MHRPFQFHERSQFFFGADDEALSVAIASVIQIVRPSRSMADTQPPTPTGFAEIVILRFPVFHATIMRGFAEAGNVIEAHAHTGDFKEW